MINPQLQNRPQCMPIIGSSGWPCPPPQVVDTGASRALQLMSDICGGGPGPKLPGCGPAPFPKQFSNICRIPQSPFSLKIYRQVKSDCSFLCFPPHSHRTTAMVTRSQFYQLVRTPTRIFFSFLSDSHARQSAFEWMFQT